MNAFEKWLVLTSAVVATVTGVVLGWMKYLLEPTDPWAVINHPWEPWVLKAHILAVPVLVFAVGMVAIDHIWKHYRAGVRSGRRSGILTMTVFAPMAVSGYLVQSVTAPLLLTVVVSVHLATGGLFAVGLALHAREFLKRRGGPVPGSKARLPRSAKAAATR